MLVSYWSLILLPGWFLFMSDCYVAPHKNLSHLILYILYKVCRDLMSADCSRNLANLKDVMDPYIKRLKEKAAAQPSEAETTIRLSSNDSIPRPSSSTYSGDMLEWREFWSLYSSRIERETTSLRQTAWRSPWVPPKLSLPYDSTLMTLPQSGQGVSTSCEAIERTPFYSWWLRQLCTFKRKAYWWHTCLWWWLLWAVCYNHIWISSLSSSIGSLVWLHW